MSSDEPGDRARDDAARDLPRRDDPALARTGRAAKDGVPDAAKAARRSRVARLSERALLGGSAVTAAVPLAALVAMLVVLVIQALPAIRYNGWHFLVGSGWNPGSTYSQPVHTGGILHLAGASYGAWPLILGTLEASAIAVLVGFPIAVGAAVFIVEKLPRALSGVVGLFLEILAGIPSVVFGLWGVLTFGPWLARDIYPALTHLPNVPVLDIFRGSTGYGEGLLTAGIVLAAMIIPLIAATTRDLLRQVPEATKEGAEALGLTSAEVFRTVQFRWVRTGVLGAAILGLGRALGETIAVALVTGSVLQSATNIYGTTTTIAATIVSQLDSAQTDPTGLYVRVLAEAALVLMAITLLVNIAARRIVRRSARGVALPVGVGF
ncbi:MAG TPA: phosphate ABC transporter permease subunit PstC [Acidimicrobiales bacterium]|nr:phosphate ABC transporter permease subunit PstC [Acidimicrobiales bacterium]